MIAATTEQTGTCVEVRAITDVPAADLFTVLASPAGHARIDGSGMVRAELGEESIRGVGQVFTMAMHHESLGDYRTDNHVLTFEPDRVIAWTTAREGQPPAGVVWSWRFADTGAGRTAITHRYDWSGVTDPAVLARVSFPRVSAESLARSVEQLVSVASGSA